MRWCSNGACSGTGCPPPPSAAQIKFCLKADLLTWLGVTFLKVFTWLSFSLSKAFRLTKQWKPPINVWIMWTFFLIMFTSFHLGLSQRPVNGWISPSIGGLPDNVSSMLGGGGRHGKMARRWGLEYTQRLAPACLGPLMQPNEGVLQWSLSHSPLLQTNNGEQNMVARLLTQPWRSLGA